MRPKQLRTAREWLMWKQHCTKRALNIFASCCRPRWHPTTGRKKRGLQFALFLREKCLVQTLQGKNDLKQHRSHRRRPAVLRLPALQGQADPVEKLGGSDGSASP